MSSPLIAVLDYGLGNLRSVVRGLQTAGAKTIITKIPEEIESADSILLPGVGAFAEGMDKIQPLIPLIRKETETKPLLGICLGMQMLLNESEEHGLTKGLGFVPGSVRLFPKTVGKVPQMGWNTIAPANHPLFDGIKEGTYVYFVHSYYADTAPQYSIATTEYGLKYASAVANKNVCGTQFHPEKSGSAGIEILKNFLKMSE